MPDGHDLLFVRSLLRSLSCLSLTKNILPPSVPIGWLIFGWTAQSHTHWIGPLIGMVIGAYGLMLSFNSLQNFTVDWCSPYSAAGVAAITFVRSIVACLLPIFGKDMFDRLGWGLGGTLMAALSLCALPAPLIMFVYGKQLRERWKIVG